MKKERTVFVCNECGYESPRWLGKCPGCGTWNSLSEFNPSPKRRGIYDKLPTSQGGGLDRSKPISLAEHAEGIDEESRIVTGIGEFDRVLGGGIVPGSLVLMSGDPGIGKSTLLLQIAQEIGAQDDRVLYVSGEESVHQIGMRAKRLSIESANVMIMAETDVSTIQDQILSTCPKLVIIDSVQTMCDSEVESSPGSVSQVKEVSARFMQIAKGMSIPVILVGHVNKTGAIAGPRVLEHMVDTVVYFEGETYHAYRMIRSVKNRFGSTNEIGIFEMTEKGLEEVENPSEALLQERPNGVCGSSIVGSIEGSRPLMVEIQALVANSSFGNPRRTTTGIDYNRAAIITAVLDKKVGIHLADQDVYISVAGGLSLSEPAVDLGVAASIVSSFKDVPILQKTALFGEIGLTGELRAVGRAEMRISEAQRLGFERCVLPGFNLKSTDLRSKFHIDLIGANTVREALEAILDV